MPIQSTPPFPHETHSPYLLRIISSPLPTFKKASCPLNIWDFYRGRQKRSILFSEPLNYLSTTCLGENRSISEKIGTFPRSLPLQWPFTEEVRGREEDDGEPPSSPAPRRRRRKKGCLRPVSTAKGSSLLRGAASALA